MAITLQATPTTLRWTDFRVVSARMADPNDGSLIDALTAFTYDIPTRTPRALDGFQFALAESFTITVKPNAQVWSGVQQTPELLTHEQFHYDVGIVTGRALARALTGLRAPTLGQLSAAADKLINLHFETRARLLQRRYDLDCHHGADPKVQSIWKERMRICLAATNPTTIGGFWL